MALPQRPSPFDPDRESALRVWHEGVVDHAIGRYVAGVWPVEVFEERVAVAITDPYEYPFKEAGR